MVFHSNCTISFTKRPQKRHGREIPVYPVFVLEGLGITNEYVQNNPTTRRPRVAQDARPGPSHLPDRAPTVWTGPPATLPNAGLSLGKPDDAATHFLSSRGGRRQPDGPPAIAWVQGRPRAPLVAGVPKGTAIKPPGSVRGHEKSPGYGVPGLGGNTTGTPLPALRNCYFRTITSGPRLASPVPANTMLVTVQSGTVTPSRSVSLYALRMHQPPPFSV